MSEVSSGNIEREVLSLGVEEIKLRSMENMEEGVSNGRHGKIVDPL